MRAILFTLVILLGFGFTLNSDCGDGTVYANKEQTGTDKRLAAFPKIDGIPKFKGGDKRMDKLIRAKLKVVETAKSQVFNLNYIFTVTCDGKIKDFKTIGDAAMEDWTNVSKIIMETEADWTPAQKDGKNVDCIYFRKLFINGSDY